MEHRSSATRRVLPKRVVLRWQTSQTRELFPGPWGPVVLGVSSAARSTTTPATRRGCCYCPNSCDLQHDGAGGSRQPVGTNIDNALADLAWRQIRDWRRRRDVDTTIRRAWVRLYVGVLRRARGVRRRTRQASTRNSRSSDCPDVETIGTRNTPAPERWSGLPFTAGRPTSTDSTWRRSAPARTRPQIWFSTAHVPTALLPLAAE